MSALLEASNLTKHYAVAQGWLKPKAIARALDGVSFSLQAGQTLAVVGESGCGKSTLARQVAMIETLTSGTLRLDGSDIANGINNGINNSHSHTARMKAARPLVQMVFQNPYASLNPRKKIGAILEEPLIINTALKRAERSERVHAIMAQVGLRPEFYQRYPHMFSGGQRQRIAIARALMLRPKVIVADEPVSALDVSIQAQVLNLLMDIQQQSQVAYLFISHNLAVVEHIADHVLVMYLGKTVEYSSKQTLFQQPRHPYTRALLASTPRIAATQRPTHLMRDGELPSPLSPPPGCAFHQRCPHAIERCRREVPLLQTYQDSLVACHRSAEIE